MLQALDFLQRSQEPSTQEAGPVLLEGLHQRECLCEILASSLPLPVDINAEGDVSMLCGYHFYIFQPTQTFAHLSHRLCLLLLEVANPLERMNYQHGSSLLAWFQAAKSFPWRA